MAGNNDTYELVELEQMLLELCDKSYTTTGLYDTGGKVQGSVTKMLRNCKDCNYTVVESYCSVS